MHELGRLSSGRRRPNSLLPMEKDCQAPTHLFPKAKFRLAIFMRAEMKVLEKTVLKTRYGMLTVFSALFLTFAAVGCSRTQVQAAPAMPPPLVTLANATAHDVPRYLDEIGRNGAFESVTVTPQVGGRITERHFQDGAQLTKGQLLFTVDARPYQAQLNSAKAQLAETRAALELAATQLKMYSSITDERAVSELDLETKHTGSMAVP